MDALLIVLWLFLLIGQVLPVVLEARLKKKLAEPKVDYIKIRHSNMKICFRVGWTKGAQAAMDNAEDFQRFVENSDALRELGFIEFDNNVLKTQGFTNGDE